MLCRRRTVIFPSHRVASIEDLLARCSPPVGRLVEAARRRVLTAVPAATERLRAGWGLIGYDAPAYFAYLAPMKDHVRIGFERGAVLEDPGGLLQGTGTQVRHVEVRSATELRAPALAALLRQAAGLRGPGAGRPTGRAARRVSERRELLDLEGIGPAMLADLERLGVREVATLSRQEPRALYDRLCRLTGVRQDPCVLDTFSCAVAQARDPELPAAQRKWWWWSRLRLRSGGAGPRRSRR
jgi:hypothetical protein